MQLAGYFVPKTIAIGRGKPEGILSGFQVGVGGESPVGFFGVPFLIVSDQLVFVECFLGRGIIKAGKMEGEIIFRMF